MSAEEVEQLVQDMRSTAADLRHEAERREKIAATLDSVAGKMADMARRLVEGT